ncbi:MAG: histidine phosphatase family protein [Anaerolineaceae bacterium]|nr:histidine phosphatase family protein [Anaerolineaceae bacterium]
MTTLVLLRHGETDWNLNHRYQGLTDIPLNSTGEKQAVRANQLLKDFKFDAVYCSDLDRAQTTARLALKGIFPYEKIKFDRRLRERSFGTYEGGPYDKELLPKEYRTSMDADPENFKFPEGESLIEVEKRIHPFFDEIIRNHPNDTVLLVAHGSLLSMIFFIIENKPVCDKNRKRLKNAEPYILEIKNE